MTVSLQTRADQLALSKALKQSTAAAHEQAEFSTFMQDLMEGRLTVAAFTELQMQAFVIYQALEQAARAVADDPIAAPLCDWRLERQARLAADLEQLCGEDFRDRIAPTEATSRYVARLEEIAATKDAPALVAHHYVRYLGDLSGGQVIARLMQRHYDIDPAALTFYQFSELGKVKPYKDRYRQALDALVVDEAQRERILQEAVEAFKLNFALFHELGNKHYS